MSGTPRIVYAPRHDATPEAELYALAGVYRFLLDCRANRAKKEGGPTTAPDDAKEGSKHDSRHSKYTG